MSRTCLPRRPVRTVLALAVGATSLVGLGQASAGPAPAPKPAAVTYAVTGVSPSYVEAGVPDAFGVTLTGKGFTRRTKVTFSCGQGGSAGTSIAPATVTATKLVVRPPSCAPGTHSITITEGDAALPTSTLAGKLTFLATPKIVVPVAPEGEPGATPAPAAKAVTPATGPWSGGTVASLQVVEDLPAKAAVQVHFTADGVTRTVPGKVDAKDLTRISFKVPAGVPGVLPDVAVGVFGVLSDPVEGQFEHVSTIRTTPAVWVRGAAAPAVKIDGAGFTSAASVTICGQPATLVAGKASAKSLVVTPPTWSAVAPAVDAAAGGVCTVQVTVGRVVSAVTAGSTFTYAAH